MTLGISRNFQDPEGTLGTFGPSESRFLELPVGIFFKLIEIVLKLVDLQCTSSI